MRENLATLLDDFRRSGRETAVVRYKGIRRRTTTYAEVAVLAGRFAALLARRGIAAGERVLIWAENSAEWIAAFHGCLLRGVVAVPLDPYGSADFAARVCADVKPRLAVGDAMLLRQLPCEVERQPFEQWSSILPAQEAGPVAGLTADTPLQILFTSGTTGDPKGIVHTHGNVLASAGPIEAGARPYLRYERLIHPLRILHTLPLSHVFGQMMGLWVPPIFTAELHFENRLVASRLVEIVRGERISVLAAVPRIHALIKTHLEVTLPGLTARLAGSPRRTAVGRWWRFRDVHRALGLKFWALISGGGALPAPLEQSWNAMGFVLVQGYGMTETTALITLNHPFHVASGSIGKPLAGREVKLGPDGEVLVRGASISHATWSAGHMTIRPDEWLATGDLAEREPSGGLRFLGRKSEVIVTGAGVNVHPEDLESAVEQQAGVLACAVVPVGTPQGPEPCAVLAMRGDSPPAAAIERANTRLAEFQRIRRWVLWPEPDLPRTSTGKVRRKAVAEWLAAQHNGAGPTARATAGAGQETQTDWLLRLIAQITGETPAGGGDELRLSEDLHLDSLARVQLTAAIEERMGAAPEDGKLDEAETLGQLRRLLRGGSAAGASDGGATLPSATTATPRQPAAATTPAQTRDETHPPPSRGVAAAPPAAIGEEDSAASPGAMPSAQPLAEPAERWGGAADAGSHRKYLYPHWPWWLPVRWARNVFTEFVMRPLVWLLAEPTVNPSGNLAVQEPLLIIANHITAYDGPLIKYALPARMRRRLAVAMSGEMLEDFRHFRNPDKNGKGFYAQGPLFYYLVTAFFNVFPLPRLRDFHRSFEHAGEALDRGMDVLVFPEGRRTPEGKMERFRPGIGLLVKQADTAVLPVALCGLGELKVQGRGWFRSGTIEVRLGMPIRFAPDATEAAITARLQAEVEALMAGLSPSVP
jgi:long-chain acyl-CoA synthetase